MGGLLRISEAASRLGVHPHTLRTWTLEGRIRSVKLNACGDRRFYVADIDSFLADLNGDMLPVASGLSEKRRGLAAAIAAGRKEFTVLWVAHEDRLARFGVTWNRVLLAEHGVEVRVLHPKGSGAPESELVADFVALVASFSGRLCGQRSAEARRRLLEHVKP